MHMELKLKRFRRSRNAILHALLWSFFILVNYGLNRIFIIHYSFWDSLLLNIIPIGIFYWIIDSMRLIDEQKKRLYALGLFVLSFFLLLRVAYSLIYPRFHQVNVVQIDESLSTGQNHIPLNFYLLFFLDLIFAFLFSFLLIVEELAGNNQQVLIKKENLTTELNRYRANFLTAQIYPHFVKNTFQGLARNALKRGDENDVDTLVLLSELMDYTTEQVNAENATVYVKKELNQLEKLLSIIRLQKEDDQVIEYSKVGTSNGTKIPSITLLTFLENVFKYGVISPEHPLQILTVYSKEKFLFTCKNRKKTARMPIHSSKIGLDNIRQRLDLNMPGQFELMVNEDEIYFEVQLKIMNDYET